jgi:YidC/Oxa1 family membrane protein insertase
MITAAYHLIIANPLLNILVLLYNTVAFHDLGIAIIILTVIIRLALYPLFQKSMKHQLLMQEIQPKIKAIQEEHKKDYEKQSQAMMALYKEHNINPFAGFGLLIVQLPILWAIYRLFLHIFQPGALDAVYHFFTRPTALPAVSMGFINLQHANWPIVIITAFLQYLQTRMSISSNPAAASSAQVASLKMMSFVAPIITLVIFSRLPASVTLYWLATSLISIGQQYMINRQRSHADPRPQIIRQ